MLEEDRRAHATAAAVAWLQGTLDDISSFLFEDRDSQKPSRNSAQLILLTENARLTRAAQNMGVRHCCTCLELLDMMPESAKYSNNERVRLQRLAEELLIAKQSKIDAAKKEQDGILGMKNKEGEGEPWKRG